MREKVWKRECKPKGEVPRTLGRVLFSPHPKCLIDRKRIMFHGWSQIVTGVVIAIVVIGAMFDRSVNRIWIGGFFLAAWFIFQGIRALNEEAEKSKRLAESLSTPPDPDADSYDDVRSPFGPPVTVRKTQAETDTPSSIAIPGPAICVHVNCESCAKSYVYFPERTEAAMAQYHRFRHSAAPCPRCGWLQKDMFDLEQEFNNKPNWSANLLFVGIFFFLATSIFFVVNTFSFLGPPGTAKFVANESLYWYSNLILFLLSVGCCGIWFWRDSGLPNPNAGPLDRRLEKGKILGMTLEEFEKLEKK